MHMLGLSKRGFAGVVFLRGMMLFLPAVIIGYICALPCLWALISQLLGSELGSDEVSILPSAHATIEAVLIGLLIPLLASIGSVRNAVDAQLNS